MLQYEINSPFQTELCVILFVYFCVILCNVLYLYVRVIISARL